MLTEGPADGASDVEIVASMVSLDKRQRGRRNVNMYRQEKKEKLETKGSAFHSKSCVHFQPWGWFLEQPSPPDQTEPRGGLAGELSLTLLDKLPFSKFPVKEFHAGLVLGHRLRLKRTFISFCRDTL